MAMGDQRAAPIMPVPKDLTREELSIAFRVIGALRGLRFGSVQLQVHEGKVVQIDVAEKLRLRDSPRGFSPPPLPTDGLPAERKD
jgi:hypothetical protein